MEKKAFRITNITNIATQSRGFFLDLGADNGGKHIGVGKNVVLEANSYDTLPACVIGWAEKNFVRVLDLGEKLVVGGPAMDGEMTPSGINPVSEARGSEEDEFDAEPDLSSAVVAALPDQENFNPINQSSSGHAKTRISEAMAEERSATDISPIPGDRPMSVDDTADFTVRAGRSNQPGAVISRSK